MSQDLSNTPKWYHFSQNNSGGHFIVDDEVAHSVPTCSSSVHAASPWPMLLFPPSPPRTASQ